MCSCCLLVPALFYSEEVYWLAGTKACEEPSDSILLLALLAGRLRESVESFLTSLDTQM